MTTMNTGAASLLPCPFCGGADIQRGRAAIGERPTFHTYCNSCEAGTQGHPTREASDAAWNRRTTPQADAAPSGVSDGLRKLIAAAADCISEAVTFEQDGFDTAPMPATQWDYNADQLAYALRAELATIAAGGAQETIYQRNMSGAWIDTTLLGYENWPEDQRRIVYASPLPREAATVPPEVIAWRDAYQAYVDATAQYNSHLEYVRAHCPFGTSVDAQYQAMNEAQRKAFALLKPMHAALLAAASNGEQA